MKTYYKVVRRELTSSYGSNSSVVQYVVNDFVAAPKNTKLFVFNDLSAARDYINRESWLINTNRFHVYKCIVKNPRKATYIQNKGFAEEYWNVVALAKKRKQNINKALLQSGYGHANSLWPAGTVFCDAVKLTEKV